VVDSIKPFIFRIEGWNGLIENLHFTNGAMTTSWLDQNRHTRPHVKEFTIEFHLPTAFEDEIDLGMQFVIVSPGIVRNFDDMQ